MAAGSLAGSGAVECAAWHLRLRPGPPGRDVQRDIQQGDGRRAAADRRLAVGRDPPACGSGRIRRGRPEAAIAAQMAHDISRPQMRRRLRPNGTAIDIRTAPLPDGGHISVVTDISALVQAEAELRRHAEDMSTMLDNIRHGIMLWGSDRRLIASNPVAADLLDLPTDLLIPGRNEAEVIDKISELGHFGTAGESAPLARKLLDLDRSLPFGRGIATPSGRVLYA